MCEWSCATRIELCLCLSAPANWQQPQQQQQSLTTTPSSDNNNFIKMSASKGQNFCCPSTELPEQPEKPPPVVAPPPPHSFPLAAVVAATVTAFIHFIWKANICAHFKSSSSCSSTFNSISIYSFPLSFIFCALILMRNWMQNPNLNAVATAKKLFSQFFMNY